MSDSVSRRDYCQYLLVSQINYTLTNYANHCEKFAHDAINRFLRQEKFTPRLVWENVQAQVVVTEQGYVVFDDTVLDKNYSFAIELVRRQYSGNAHGIIKGIGVVTCVYVNPELDQFWLIDFRIYDPEGDGKTKLDHVREMLTNIVYQKQLPFHAVLMDTWYATKDLMLFIESLKKIYYCPLKNNRRVDDSGGKRPYQSVDSLDWSAAELASGKTIKIKDFPRDHKVRCFRVETSTRRTDWVVSNDPAQDSTEATQKVCGFRWKIEQLHREGKQVTGLERCQCRKARIQRNHIACAFLVWVRLKELATDSGRTIYQLKHGLLSTTSFNNSKIHLLGWLLRKSYIQINKRCTLLSSTQGSEEEQTGRAFDLMNGKPSTVKRSQIARPIAPAAGTENILIALWRGGCVSEAGVAS